MAFQSQVYTSVAPGVPGDLATPDQAIYQAQQYTAEADCKVGNFCFAGTDAATQAKPGAVSGLPLGLVQRVINYVNYSVTSNGTLVVPAGNTLTVAVLGDFFVKTSTQATVGQAVFASLTDGSISTASSGSTVAGSVETAWRVVTAGAANSTIIISNWSIAATNAASIGGTVAASQITGTLGVAHGGTGLTTLGTAGQVLKTNAGATAMEWAADATE